MSDSKFAIGDRVRKHSGSWWEGKIVGGYSTDQTDVGHAVQLDMVPNGPVQIYPEAALEFAPKDSPVSIVSGSEDDIVEAMIESLRDPFPLTMLSISGGIDRWREIMRTALLAANRYRQPGVTISAETVLAIRDALIGDSVEEAYHQLYRAVDPYFIKLHPWEEIERAALSVTATEGE